MGQNLRRPGVCPHVHTQSDQLSNDAFKGRRKTQHLILNKRVFFTMLRIYPFLFLFSCVYLSSPSYSLFSLIYICFFPYFSLYHIFFFSSFYKVIYLFEYKANLTRFLFQHQLCQQFYILKNYSILLLSVKLLIMAAPF